VTTLVVGLGRRDRGDDAVGPVVARMVADLRRDDAAVHECDEPSGLLDAWQGHDSVVVVDAVVSGSPPGTVHVLDAEPEGLGAAGARATAGRGGTHALGLVDVIGIARALGRLPRRVVVVAVEAARFDHGAGLSPAVEGAVPAAAAAVVAQLDAG
jgi:hydrogenase maturation protease